MPPEPQSPPYIIVVETPREGVVQGHSSREPRFGGSSRREESEDLIWLLAVRVLDRHIDHGLLHQPLHDELDLVALDAAQSIHGVAPGLGLDALGGAARLADECDDVALLQRRVGRRRAGNRAVHH